MAKCSLKEEIELMLKLVPGAWRVKCYKHGIADFICSIVGVSDWRA